MRAGVDVPQEGATPLQYTAKNGHESIRGVREEALYSVIVRQIKKVAYSENHNEVIPTYPAPSSGTYPPRLLTSSDGDDGLPAWSKVTSSLYRPSQA